MANTDYLSLGTAGATVFSDVSLSGDMRASSVSASVVTVSAGIAASAITATSRITTAALNVSNSLIASSGVVNLAGAQILSGKTLAVSGITNGASIASNEIIWTFGASGHSLVIRSGQTLWIIGSTVSAAVSG